MRAHLRTVAVVALAAALLAWFLRNANLGLVWDEIRHGNPGMLALAIGTIVATYVLRAVRWRYLLLPLGDARLWPCFRTTVIGFAASALLPARAGEVVRPYLLAKEEGLSATAAFATIIVERLLDLLTVLVLFAMYLIVFDTGMASLDPAIFRALQAGGMAAGVLAVAVLIVMMVLAGHPERLAVWALRAERVLPRRVAVAVARLVQLFVEGLAVVRQPSRMAIGAALSLPLWLAIATGIWASSRAFHIEMPFTGSFLMLAILVVGVAVPTPGAVGGFHEAYRIGVTVFFHTPNDKAVGAAIVLHAISFVLVAIVGVALMMQAGLNLGRVGGIAARRPAEEAL